MAKSIVIETKTKRIRVGDAFNNLLVELRPKEWVKNLVVLAPLFFSRNLFIPEATIQSFTALVLFCCISSSVYLLNDVRDRKQDQLHPQKRLRPIAAGKLSIGVALVAMFALFVVAVAGGIMLNKDLAFVLLAYWLVNLLYSVGLKQKVILDVFAIAFGFVLRVIGGAVVINVEMSHWLLICTSLLALFLGFSKRRHEMELLGEEAIVHRQVLKDYSPHFLDMMIAVVTASTVMSYALYTVSEETVRRFHTRGLIVTIPFVLYGIFRYLYLIYRKNQGGNPARDLLTDSSIIINLCLWAAVTGVILYWRAS